VGLTNKIAAGAVALSMLASTPAFAAARTQAVEASLVSPWVALSALGSTNSGAALCAGAAAAAANSSAQAGVPGCVLPLVDAAPAPVAAAPAPVAAPIAPVAAARGIGFLPILLGLATLAAGIALLAGSGKDNPINPPPVSPA
jgi:2-oxoglutarate dehydrogenase E2 component (dihydrolipoamide succinyltransferase)